MLLVADLVEIIKESLIQYFYNTKPLEWWGVASGILCVWLAAKNKILSWPIAIVSVTIYIFIFFESKLYADMGLQFYFLITNVYGWYYWNQQKNKPKTESKIGMITPKEILLSIGAIAVFTFFLGFFLYKKTDASFPFLDSFCTACSLVAQIFLARKVLQNWLIWIFVDIIYVSVYFSKELYATGLMYALYIIIATIGFLDWRKIYREQSH